VQQEAGSVVPSVPDAVPVAADLLREQVHGLGRFVAGHAGVEVGQVLLADTALVVPLKRLHPRGSSTLRRQTMSSRPLRSWSRPPSLFARGSGHEPLRRRAESLGTLGASIDTLPSERRATYDLRRRWHQGDLLAKRPQWTCGFACPSDCRHAIHSGHLGSRPKIPGASGTSGCLWATSNSVNRVA